VAAGYSDRVPADVCPGVSRFGAEGLGRERLCLQARFLQSCTNSGVGEEYNVHCLFTSHLF